MLPKKFCSLCLSSDRKLSFSDEVVNIFHKYFSETTPILENFCFECLNMLRKMEKFREKVMLAQKLMKLRSLGCMKGPMKSLSTLSCRLITDSGFTVKDEDVKILDIEFKDEVKAPHLELTERDENLDLPKKCENIKKEIDDDHEDHISNDCPDDEFEVGIDNIKNCPDDRFEVDIDTRNIKYEFKVSPKAKASDKKQTFKKTTPKKVKKHRDYEYVYTNKSDTYIETKIIDQTQFNDVMEMERNGIIYKSLSFKCLYENCLYGSNVKSRFNAHLKSHHCEDRKHQCDVCKVWYKCNKLLVVHVQKHLTVHKCTICDAVCHNRDAVGKHVLESHLGVVKCAYCGKHFDNVARCKIHKKAEHIHLICDICGAIKKSKASMTSHITYMHMKRTCKLCNIEFKSTKTLDDHNRLKHVIKRNEEAFCVICDRQFDNVNLFKNHLSYSAAHAHERKKPVKKSHPCKECGKVYAKNEYMMNHYMFVHKNQARFKCEICGQQCLNRTKYKQHKAFKHEGKVKEKNKICETCGRGFSSNAILTKHIRTHTGERPFQCELCPSKFSQLSALKTHVKFIHDKAKRQPT